VSEAKDAGHALNTSVFFPIAALIVSALAWAAYVPPANEAAE
jgi:hypothetical protein